MRLKSFLSKKISLFFSLIVTKRCQYRNTRVVGCIENQRKIFSLPWNPPMAQMHAKSYSLFQGSQPLKLTKWISEI